MYIQIFILITNYLLIINCLTPIIKQLNYTNVNNFTINNTIEYLLEYTSDKSLFPPRVTIESNYAVSDSPLMVVARQPKSMISWQLPLIFKDTNYMKTAHTLCPNILNRHFNYTNRDNILITVSTSSEVNVDFTINVDYDDIFIKPSISKNFIVTPSEPKYFYYNFTQTNTTISKNSNYDTVVLEVTSTDDICMTVGIQNVSCPIFDMNQDITFQGFYETVNTKGGMTIPKYKFPLGFFIVFVAKPDNIDCTSNDNQFLSLNDRIKNVTLIITPSISYDDYLYAILTTLCTIIGFYLLFGLSYFFCSIKNYIPRQMEYVIEQNDQETQPQSSCNDNISIDDYDDQITEVDHEQVTRLGKSVIYLVDLARKDPRILKYKSYLYLYNVLTVGLFYGLPVVQLVITYQKILNQTGQQDLCYYNFLCAHPLGFISDFNHVFSNVGYIFFGLLFLFIIYRREITHKDLNFDKQYGIPQHYGMFYAMGVSLIMEGVLSASYHVCPNQLNFQFDTSFMYVMAVLCMVKLYQNRHPDINATACATFGVLAVAILLGLIGILESNLLFWVIFSLIHFIICLYLSIKIYYMGCLQLNNHLLIRLYQIVINDFWNGPITVLKPMFKARLILLILGNICNWALCFLGIFYRFDFPIYLLAIFMANTLLYFIFYVTMKLIYREKVNKPTWCFLLISALCAISAMYFFLQKGISWKKTPAESKHFNHPCRLLRFYDYHDIWHFLSATGMFFTFMVLLTLDDDLSHTHHSRIRVF